MPPGSTATVRRYVFRRWIAVVAVVVAVATACGEPTIVSDAALPDPAPLDPSPTTVAASPPPPAPAPVEPSPPVATVGLSPDAEDAAFVEVALFFTTGDGVDCAAVAPVTRLVPAPEVLTGAMEALLAGPTAAETAAGLSSWFSAATAGLLNSVTISAGTARIDFAGFAGIIPNASTSCGGAALMAQLDRTATQFPSVDRAVYSFDGDVAAFYEWQQSSPPAGY